MLVSKGDVLSEHEGSVKNDEVQVDTACPVIQTSVRMESSGKEEWRVPVSGQTASCSRTVKGQHGNLLGGYGVGSCGVTDFQGGMS